MKSLSANVQNNGWSSPVAPFIAYPVQNVGWGKGDEPPPYQSRTMIPTEQLMLGPSAPRSGMVPAPAPARTLTPVPLALPPIPPTGPIPVQDWFNLLLRG